MTDFAASLKRLLALVACLALVAGPVTFARGQEPQPCRPVTGDPYWLSVEGPEFETGDATITQYAPSRPLIFATNGMMAKRWSPATCEWDTAFQVPDEPSEYGFTAATARITDIVMPDARPETVALVIEESGPEPRPHVLHSTNGGGTWTAASGLPLVGRPQSLRYAPTDPAVAYLGLDVGGGRVDLIYATTDGGATWELRSSPAQWAPDAEITGLAVDELVAAELWAWGVGGLFHSTDGGRTFTEVPELAQDVVGPVDVFHAPGEPARIAAFRPEQRDFLSSLDGGLTWERYGAPADVESVAHGATRESMLIATPAGVYAFHAPSFTFVELAAPRSGIRDLEDERTRRRWFYGRTDSSIEIYVGPAAGRILIDPPKDTVDAPLLSAPPRVPPERDPRLGGGKKRLVLEAGRERNLRYVLDLPQRRTPLDVYFLVDTSDSMTYTIQGLVNGMAAIIDDLHASAIDVQFGVGEYRAYPDSLVPRQDEPNFVYRRVRDVEPFSASLQEALEGLEADAGGRFESHLAALFHTATGEAEDVYPPGPSARDVPAGQQANFRAKALRVVIHATDSEFGREEEDRNEPVSDFGRLDAPELPTFDEVIDAFEERGILHAGLAVGSGARESRYARSEDGFPTAIGDLTRMASATGALSPGSLDCDGDGFSELSAGDPLVCALTNRSLAQGALVPAIVNLVKAVRSFEQVSLEVRRGAERVADIDPSTYRTIALQAARELDFTVTYSCPRADRRSIREVRLAARTPTAVLAEATTTVVCRPVAPFLPPPLFGPLIGLLIPPALPPVPPLTEVATSAQSQAQAQFGFAAQKQEQPQLAYVQSQTGRGLQVAEELSEDHAMSSLRRSHDEVPPERTLAAGAVMVGIAYAGLALAREKALRVQRVRR